jgi:hypothetical protein
MRINTMKRPTLASASTLAMLAGPAWSQAQYANSDTFKPLIGKWQTKQGRISSFTSEASFAPYITDWTGLIYGAVMPTGQILFKSGNNCVLSGFAAPLASNGLWTFNGKLEGCQHEHMNQRVFGNMRREGHALVLEASDLPFAVGRPPVSYYLKAQMTPY